MRSDEVSTMRSWPKRTSACHCLSIDRQPQQAKEQPTRASKQGVKHRLILRNQLYDTAARPWEGDNTSLQAQPIKTLQHWPEIRPTAEAPPVQYSEGEHQERLNRDTKQKDADEQMQQVREAIGVDIEGWVPNNRFESAKARAEAMKREMAGAADSEKERREF
ncbi:hypothetical protein V490_04281 [Pseudogymnoascus sp. VKM F-3557]|nr:hypothetical protein V490_04281 [Pseudogymnoascus sp. VKM F-3557]